MGFTKYSLIILSLLVLGCTGAKSTASSSSSTPRQAKSSPSDGIKPFSDVIKSSAEKDEGLFNVYQQEEDIFFEIPNELLGREMLLVSRVAGVPPGFSGFNSAGSKSEEQVISFTRNKDRILIRKKSYNAVADEGDPVSSSVLANNFEPVLASFDVQALSEDSSGVVINVTDFFNDDVEAISGLSTWQRRQYQVRRLDSDRSMVESIKSFPENIEVRQLMTYVSANPPSGTDAQTLTMLTSQSMVLLPEEPMMKRFADYRVGYFSIRQIDYSSDAPKAEAKQYIRRWRLEPKDPEAYARGELVEPVKPIVYYLDPATPEKYRSYIIQGVLDWNEAFEAAGFKNAVQPKLPPTPEEDPDWSPEDIRYSTIRWVASTVRNAVGPSVSDPRSGEIIESDIVWYHNHMRSYRNRLMIETGAANPAARSLQLPDELIGETMRRVISHEIGHAIGLPHNMQASSAYPVDSLRSGKFTQEWGIATTIMEYARQNYIAQPGDENIRFIRQIGPYDKYSVNWGYRVIPGAETPEDEKPILDSWIEEKAGDPVYRFASSTGYDPSAQTEDLSNDPVRASSYGLMNLKRVVPSLIEWTSEPGEDYTELQEIYRELVGQWSRYARHVATNVGGVYQTRKTSDQSGWVYTPVDKDYQIEAMEFLNEHAFSTPTWLLDQDILRRIEHAGAVERIKNLQAGILRSTMNAGVMTRLTEQEAFDDDAYSLLEMLSDLRQGLWSEVYNNRTIDTYRRSLQREYISYIHTMFEDDVLEGRFGAPDLDIKDSDIRPALRAELMQLRTDIRSARSNIRDRASRTHLDDVTARINEILNED
ncbi:MAG: zinc-dependent metalloprotease [Balneolaceae bacterium]|nr:zinc-dependent metalloprotease [Balneolaceae bacterium]MBO6547439.1 zinc-dependent metalloprotease [Balneolaceae bacterium]MBO6647614.1 zinc-dependent metalloprotease [Balneolaceae bacterium]